MYEGHFFINDSDETAHPAQEYTAEQAVPEAAVEIGYYDDTEIEGLSEPEEEIRITDSLEITISAERGDPDDDAENVQSAKDGIYEAESDIPRQSSDGGGRTPIDPPESGGVLPGPEEGEGEVGGILVSSTHIIIVSRSHDREALKVAERLVGDRRSWVSAGASQEGDRCYFTAPEEPELFVKVTPPSPAPPEGQGALDSRDAKNEMDLAPLVREVVATETVQDMAQQKGYTGIHYVAPLATVIDNATGEEVTAYPLQKGFMAAKMALEMPQNIAVNELQALAEVGEGLFDAFQASGILPEGLNTSQLMIDDDERLHLLGAGKYELFDPGTPTYQHGQVMRYQGGQWRPESETPHAKFNYPMTPFVEAGTSIAGRRNNEGENPIFAAFNGRGPIVTLTNQFTGESALINMPSFQLRSAHGERAVNQVLLELPSLATPGAIAHVITESLSVLGPTIMSGHVAYYLDLMGIKNIKLVTAPPDKIVHLHSGTGRVEVNTIMGEQIYAYQPLPPRGRAARKV